MTETETEATPSGGPPAPTVWPGLSYVNAPDAIRFLGDAFGFVEVLVVPGEGTDEVVHAELRWPEGGGVMLNTAGGDGEVHFTPPGAGSVYVVTDSPDAVAERAAAAGAEIVRAVRDEDFGSRGFVARDPEGNLWSFGTYRGA
jgi:uncharacterized glyoxalase superfamily protein PhnB